jgi:hypothetical protein
MHCFGFLHWNRKPQTIFSDDSNAKNLIATVVTPPALYIGISIKTPMLPSFQHRRLFFDTSRDAEMRA